MYGDDTQVSLLFWVIFAFTILNSLGFFVGAYLLNTLKINVKIVMLGSFLSSLAGYFLASYCKSFIPFICSYALVTGVGQGANYMTALITGWSYYPKNKGLISGISLSCYGLAASIYTPIMN